MKLTTDEINILEQVVDQITEPTYLLECADGNDVDLITYAFGTDTGRFFEMIVLLDGMRVKFTIVNEIASDEYLDIVNESRGDPE